MPVTLTGLTIPSQRRLVERKPLPGSQMGSALQWPPGRVVCLLCRGHSPPWSQRRCDPSGDPRVPLSYRGPGADHRYWDRPPRESSGRFHRKNIQGTIPPSIPLRFTSSRARASRNMAAAAGDTASSRRISTVTVGAPSRDGPSHERCHRVHGGCRFVFAGQQAAVARGWSIRWEGQARPIGNASGGLCADLRGRANLHRLDIPGEIGRIQVARIDPAEA
jgi:hypothetical protein